MKKTAEQKKEFSEELTKLVEKHGYTQFIITLHNHETRDAATLITGGLDVISEGEQAIFRLKTQTYMERYLLAHSEAATTAIGICIDNFTKEREPAESK